MNNNHTGPYQYCSAQEFTILQSAERIRDQHQQNLTLIEGLWPKNNSTKGNNYRSYRNRVKMETMPFPERKNTHCDHINERRG